MKYYKRVYSIFVSSIYKIINELHLKTFQLLIQFFLKHGNMIWTLIPLHIFISLKANIVAPSTLTKKQIGQNIKKTM